MDKITDNMGYKIFRGAMIFFIGFMFFALFLEANAYDYEPEKRCCTQVGFSGEWVCRPKPLGDFGCGFGETER